MGNFVQVLAKHKDLADMVLVAGRPVVTVGIIGPHRAAEVLHRQPASVFFSRILAIHSASSAGRDPHECGAGSALAITKTGLAVVHFAQAEKPEHQSATQIISLAMSALVDICNAIAPVRFGPEARYALLPRNVALLSVLQPAD